MQTETERVPLKEAHRSLSSLVGRARHAGKRFVLTANGQPACAVVSIRDLEQLENQENTK
jgi:prevent-host-death family protein